MSSPKHVIKIITVNAGELSTVPAMACVCTCGFRGRARGLDVAEDARMDGLQHAIEVATSVLPADLRPTFEG
jgi:hypothetical protein